MKNLLASLGVVGLIALSIVLIGIGPLLTIFALNVFLPVHMYIFVTWETWLAVLWIGVVLRGVFVK